MPIIIDDPLEDAEWEGVSQYLRSDTEGNLGEDVPSGLLNRDEDFPYEGSPYSGDSGDEEFPDDLNDWFPDEEFFDAWA